jgi:endonuclease YncB( thermonuclease family)
MLAMLLLAACSTAPPPAPPLPAPVVEAAPAPPAAIDRIVGKAKVVTGDVLEVEGQRVRLQAVDAPAVRTAQGQRARTEMRRIIGREPVGCELLELEPPSPHVKQGWIGRCRAGEVDVAQELVRRGWARALQRYGDSYVIEEASARAAGRGMWPKPPRPGTKPARRPASHKKAG